MTRNHTHSAITRWAVRFAGIFFLLAGVAAGHGTHDERVELYSAKIKRDPDDANARHELAMAYVENGDWTLAILQLDAAEKLNCPDSGLDFSVTRARAFAIGGRFKAALKTLNGYIDRNPDDATALIERARVLTSLGERTAGLADYQKAVSHIPRATPDLCMEIAELQIKQGQPDNALATVHRAISIHGNDPVLVLKAMEMEISAGLFDEALTHIGTMTRLMPRPEAMMAKRASVLAQAGRMAESRQAWAALIKHIDALPNLQRGTPAISSISKEAHLALAAGDSKSSAQTSSVH